MSEHLRNSFCLRSNGYLQSGRSRKERVDCRGVYSFILKKLGNSCSLLENVLMRSSVYAQKLDMSEEASHQMKACTPFFSLRVSQVRLYFCLVNEQYVKARPKN